MFNLEYAITLWRRQMATGGVKSRRVLDELESHLRDDIEQQVRSGINVEPAFLAAAERIGPASSLTTEFSKVRRPEPAARLKLLNASCIAFGALVMLIGAWTFLDSESSLLERNLGMFAVSVLALYSGSIPWLYRVIPDLKRALRIAGVIVNLWIFLALFTALDVIHIQLNLGFSMAMWAFCTAFVATVVAAIAHSHAEVEGFAGTGSLVTREDFTPKAKAAMDFARDEARLFHHDFIGTEHLLLGLLRLDQGVALKVLRRLGLELEIVRLEIEKQIARGAHPAPAGDIPFTPRARKALALAAGQAGDMSQSHIGAEHILLGLLLEPEGVAGRVLKILGVQFETARAVVLKELGPDGSDGPQPVPAA
jgi:hypothetical protein